MERIREKIKGSFKKLELLTVVFYTFLSGLVIWSISTFKINYKPDTTFIMTEGLYNKILIIMLAMFILIVIGYGFITRLYFLFKKVEKDGEEKDILIKYIISKQTESELNQLERHSELSGIILGNRKLMLNKMNKDKSERVV